MSTLPITRVVLYKHGVGYFERESAVEGDTALTLTFRQSEVSDVLKSLTVLDLDGGHVASVSYDSTKPLEQLLAEVALSIPDQASLVSLLPQIKGARVALHSGVAEPVQGSILGIDTTERQTGDGLVRIVLLSLLTDNGDVRSFDLHALAAVQILDPGLRRDLDFYLKTQLSAKKKDARTFTFFAQGQGRRTIRVSYTLEAPVWKATYRILLGEEGRPPTIQGWAVVDNMQDEDWENVQLSLIAGLPVSFVHDLYTPRYIRRPEVKVQETTGVLPPMMEEGIEMEGIQRAGAGAPVAAGRVSKKTMLAAQKLADLGPLMGARDEPAAPRSGISSTPAQIRERQIGDLFEYEIEHPVTIKRNQSALVPIVQRGFEGRPVLLYNKQARADNPMRCVEFKNTTGLTLEGGPVTVLEGGSYVGEAMLETTKPDDERLVPYAVELAVHVMDSVESHSERVHRVIVKDGQLKAHYVQVQQTTYHLKNKSDAGQVVYLEHPRPGKEWTLFDTPEPHEITENYWRFRFTIEPRKTTAFVVRQRYTLSQVYGLADVRDRQLTLWLDEKYLDNKTAAALQIVVAARQEAARHDAALAALEKERTGIHNEQKRIRENLQALGDRPGEKELRERFVRTLNTQEDRLAQIDGESQEQERSREQSRTRIAELLAKLEYDAEV
jgi:hypothetical protein